MAQQVATVFIFILDYKWQSFAQEDSERKAEIIIVVLL